MSANSKEEISGYLSGTYNHLHNSKSWLSKLLPPSRAPNGGQLTVRFNHVLFVQHKYQDVPSQ